MSIGELIPALHSMPDADKLRLIRILAEDLTQSPDAALAQVADDLPVWTPLGACDAAETLHAFLEEQKLWPTDSV